MSMIFPEREDKPMRIYGTYEQCKNMTSQKRLEVTKNIAMCSTRQGLEKMKQIVDNEIRLSENAIKKGVEDKNEK